MQKHFIKINERAIKMQKYSRTWTWTSLVMLVRACQSGEREYFDRFFFLFLC